MLPCESCGFHLRRFLKNYPGGARHAASCRDALQCFFVEAHNGVSAHTRPDAAPWTPEGAAVFYSTGPLGPEPRPLEWTTGAHLVRTEERAGAPACGCSPPGTPRGKRA